MHIEQTENEIILRDSPLRYRILGLICSLFFGALFVGLVRYAYNSPHQAFNSEGEGLPGKVFAIATFALALVFLGAFFAVFFFMFLMPVITTNINRNAQTIEVTRKNLFRKKVERFYFSQVQGFGVNRVTTTSSPSFYLVLILVNKTQIEVQTKERPEAELEKLAEKLNSFIKSAK